MMITPKLALPMIGAAVVALTACSSYWGTHDVRAAYGCTGPNAAETCHYPTYAGTVIIGGSPYQYLHYRDTSGGREYWVNGIWRKADAA
jgi:hypothetical protein